MIILRNYTTNNTYIQLHKIGYSFREKEQYANCGIGGFTDDDKLIGLYVYNEELYFHYNNISYKALPKDIYCVNKTYKVDSVSENLHCNFIVNIKNIEVCNIKYIPYISPLALPFGDDVDEFDYLAYLSKLMESEETLNNFIKGMLLVRDKRNKKNTINE